MGHGRVVDLEGQRGSTFQIRRRRTVQAARNLGCEEVGEWSSLCWWRALAQRPRRRRPSAPGGVGLGEIEDRRVLVRSDESCGHEVRVKFGREMSRDGSVIQGGIGISRAAGFDGGGSRAGSVGKGRKGRVVETEDLVRTEVAWARAEGQAMVGSRSSAKPLIEVKAGCAARADGTVATDFALSASSRARSESSRIVQTRPAAGEARG